METFTQRHPTNQNVNQIKIKIRTGKKKKSERITCLFKLDHNIHYKEGVKPYPRK